MTCCCRKDVRRKKNKQEIECCSSGFDVDYFGERNRRVFKWIEMSFGQLKSIRVAELVE